MRSGDAEGVSQLASLDLGQLQQRGLISASLVTALSTALADGVSLLMGPAVEPGGRTTLVSAVLNGRFT